MTENIADGLVRAAEPERGAKGVEGGNKQESEQAAENNSPPPVLLWKEVVVEISYTLTAEEISHRLFTPMSRRDRLGALAGWLIPIPFCVMAYFGYLSVLLLYLVVAYYGFFCLLLTSPWIIRTHAAWKHKSTVFFVDISETDFYLRVGETSGAHLPWRLVQDVADIGDYLMFTSNEGWHLAVIPKSAFDTSEQAQNFFMQSHWYCSAAKRKHQDEAEEVAGSGPPAPSMGNSVEPGDRPKC